MTTTNENRVLVVYACRKQDENAKNKFVAFWKSYHKHDAGYDHDLLIVKKGFDEFDPVWDDLESRISHLTYATKECPDKFFLSGYYREIIEDNPDKYVLFLTSSSEFFSNFWLEKMMRHASPDRVLGTCAAFTSLSTHYLRKNAFPPLILKNLLRSSKATRKKWWNHYLGRPPTISDHPLYTYDHFLPFPNPGIRTNAFMVPPGILNCIAFWPKTECYVAREMELVFESGIPGLSKQVMLSSMELLVIGADGVAYPMEKWYSSNTYNTENQENLLIGDHRTRMYENAAPSVKKDYERTCYGNGDIDMDEVRKTLSKLDASTFESHFYRIMEMYRTVSS